MSQPSTQRLGLPALLSALMLAVILLPTIVHGRRTSHCYTCRSRGQLGDCRTRSPTTRPRPTASEVSTPRRARPSGAASSSREETTTST
uniref:Putative secreted protein n=1 Tax=Ixodes ricinus TaxID=34613 RepID=V5GEC5_IXORI